VAHLAVFADASGARRAEQLLGRLCADGLVDVLDGALIDGPPDGCLSWRPLENLPRLAALPEPVWAALTEEVVGHRADPGRTLLPSAPPWPSGGAAVLVFCASPSTDVSGELRRAGASVTDTPVEAGSYTALRRGDLPVLASPTSPERRSSVRQRGGFVRRYQR
jgi:hypothetical protein